VPPGLTGRLTVGGPAHFTLVHGDPLSDPGDLRIEPDLRNVWCRGDVIGA
jgi:hypothetical protein